MTSISCCNILIVTAVNRIIVLLTAVTIDIAAFIVAAYCFNLCSLLSWVHDKFTCDDVDIWSNEFHRKFNKASFGV